jgi:cytidine deaminase
MRARQIKFPACGEDEYFNTTKSVLRRPRNKSVEQLYKRMFLLVSLQLGRKMVLSAKIRKMEEKTFTVNYRVYTGSSEFDHKDKELIRCAQEAQQHSYAPYSGFQVGVSLRMADGSLIGHGNLENASYSLCLCAERSALAAAAVMFPGMSVGTICISASAAQQMVSPCGACRQVISETEARQKSPVRVLMQGNEGQWLEFPSATALLPFPFGPENLL